MAALFTRQANTIYRLVIAAGLAAPVVLVLGLMFFARSPLALERFNPLAQPIQFDHRHHAGDDGIPCLYCHNTAEVSAHAGVPPVSLCVGCHAQIWTSSPLLDPLRASYFADQPIPWQKVHILPDFAYFNHSIHVNKGVGCVSCHGRVDLMPVVERVAPLTMGWCLDCHRDPIPHLRPLEKIADMRWRPPAGRELGEQLARQYDVHTRVSCTTCHR